MDAQHLRLVEVGMRDGLQNEVAILPTARKIAFIAQLVAAGVREIEVGSFVRPDRVPALADTAAVMAGIARDPDVRYIALVPNAKGMTRALAAHVPTVAVFTAASEAFTHNNINMTIAQSLAAAHAVADMAHVHGVAVRGYASTCWVCPYEGPVDVARVLDVARDLLAMGCYEVSLGDTIGAATPSMVAALLAVLLPELPVEKLAVHFHDTHGRALDNIAVAVQHGIRVIDASVGGLGGCPYAPGAAGNVATESVVAWCAQHGWKTGIALDVLHTIGADLRRALGVAHR